MSETIYCQNWSFKGPGKIITERTARKRYGSGIPFTIVVPPRQEGGQPTLITVAWCNKYLETVFLNRLGRQSVKYMFDKIDEEWMFLRTVYIHTYPTDDPDLDINEAVRIEHHKFHGDDRLTLTVKDKIAQEREKTEYDAIDFASNWEPVPTFGDWASVARFERKPTVQPGAEGKG